MADNNELFPRELQHGLGGMMSLDSTRLLLAFREAHTAGDVAAKIKPLALVLEDEHAPTAASARLPERESVNHTPQRFWSRTADGRAMAEADIRRILDALKDILAWVGPVYRLAGTRERGGLLCPLPNVLLVRFATTDGKEKINDALRRFHMTEVAEKSRFMQPYSYFSLASPETQSSYVARSFMLSELQGVVLEARFENMPLTRPLTVVPNDTLFAQQWDMTRIGAGGPGATGWDLSTGSAAVVVCVLDTGCDLAHPDLSFSAPGINLGTMLPDGSPTGNHGTACAGIVAARFNNALGVAGVAGNCQILPVAFQNWTDAEAAAGINYAADNGARVISMSFGAYLPGEGLPANWDFTIIDPAIAHAHNDRDVVLCAATGNENIGTHNRYPARHPLVIACGASDEADNRKRPASPDGEGWGANYGIDTYLGQTTAVGVVAPGVHIPTTDRQGANGYNPAPGVAGDYFLTFNGTSSAAPHVAGLAAVIRSLNPALTSRQVRTVIERTAEKVGVVPYANVPGFPNGSRNQEMGYGRINLRRALDFADVLIRDYPADNGTEPSTPPGGDFWDFSDMVVRIFDDGVFAPDDPLKSSNVERGQTNYIYVQVTNNGPHEARNVVVNCRITPYVGLQFVYPSDWATVDATHVSPASMVNTFATIPSGGTAMAKFTISAAQTNDLWGWITSHPWHPCMLASVTADNDYAFASAMFTGDPQSVLKNNLAQRNLSVIDVLASATLAWPMVAGNRANAERVMELVIQRVVPSPMELFLELDAEGSAFPAVDFDTAGIAGEVDENATIFLDRTRLEVTLGCCRGLLTLAKGSRFECLAQARIGKVEVIGGDVVLRGGKRYVNIRSDRTVVRMEKAPNRIYPLALHATIPADAVSKQQYRIRVSQRGAAGETVGGAGIVYVVR